MLEYRFFGHGKANDLADAARHVILGEAKGLLLFVPQQKADASLRSA
jgi:hypothetical protein